MICSVTSVVMVVLLLITEYDFYFPADAQFITSPENLAVVKNDTAKAKMQSKANTEALYMTWQQKKLTSQQFVLLTAGGNLIPDYEPEGYVLDKTNDEFNLEAPVTSMDYAGDFWVQASSPLPATNRYAQLTILGKYLFCTYFIYTCIK